MNISGEVLIGGIAMLTSGGIAFGIVKGTLHNYIRHDKHRDICHEKSVEIYTKLDKMTEQQGEILHALGRIEGRLNGKALE